MAATAKKTPNQAKDATNVRRVVTRVQTGVRIEGRVLKVLKALAEHLDMSLGELIEGITLHSFEGVPAFSDLTLRKIKQLKKVYDLDLRAADSHQLVERRNEAAD